MAPDDLQPGDVIAGHRILGVAGRGGMGVVYRAEQLDLERTVALKLIATPLAGDEDFRSRFVREARAAAAIDHPNVIPVFSAGEDAGRLYLSMRYVDGEDLRGRVRREGPLAPGVAAALVAQVGAALDAAHHRGLVHRDIKPANVLLDGDHAYLTDFGLTKRLTGEATVTGPGHWVGTLGYIAPEQLRGEPIDARTDVYALGCVLFFLLTAVAPHRRDTEEAGLLAQLHEPPPDPRDLEPSVPEALAHVVQRAMAKDPDDRFPSAGDLGRAAQAAAGTGPAPGPERMVARGAAAPAGAGDEETAVAGSSSAATEIAPAAAVHRARPRVWAAAALGALVVLAAVVVILDNVLGGDALDTGGVAPPVTATTPVVARGPHVVQTVRVDARPNGLAYIRGRVWVAGGRSGRLIGLSDGDAPRRTIRLPWSTGTRAIAAGFGSLWVTNGPESRIARIDPVTGGVEASIPLTPGDAISVSTGSGSVWVGRRPRIGATAPDSLIKIDPQTNRVSAELIFGEEGVGSVAAGEGQVYVTNRLRDRVSRVDPATAERHSTPVGRNPGGLDVGAGFVWVANQDADTVTQLTPGLRDPFTGATGIGPVGVAVAADGVWISNRDDSTVQRLDRTTGERLGESIKVGRNPFAIVAHGGDVWVTSLADATVSRIATT